MKTLVWLRLMLSVLFLGCMGGCELPPGATPYHSSYSYQSYPDFYNSYPFYDPFFDDPFYDPFYTPNSFSYGYYYYPHYRHLW